MEFYHFEGDDLILNVLGTPSAKMDKIGKVRGDELKITVKAAAEDGKATDYMVKFLAKEFGVKRSAITVVFGQTSIHKQFCIASPTKLPEVVNPLI